MMSTSSSMQLGASAMNAYSWGMAVTAHNVANVNTAGFEPQRAVYANNSHNQGVSFDAVLKDAGSAAAQNPDWTAAKAVYDVTSGLPLEASAPSGTDLSREFTTMISAQHAYEANAQVVRASDSMLGTLLDIKA
ncbi:flagellar basal-body rod protein [Desulfovibrio desulfuricans]|uniref:Flagellar basal-body rod protein n=2 Tax=Desulfovibrio desulfuricans TaxID=876 RepID=A0A4P7UH57_DESDE|nr:flagellar basal-body rod protein [Desulfovibrio desulfuricans]